MAQFPRQRRNRRELLLVPPRLPTGVALGINLGGPRFAMAKEQGEVMHVPTLLQIAARKGVAKRVRRHPTVGDLGTTLDPAQELSNPSRVQRLTSPIDKHVFFAFFTWLAVCLDVLPQQREHVGRDTNFALATPLAEYPDVSVT